MLKDEGEVKDFLGICVACDPQNGTIMLTQSGLIDSVLQDLGLLSHELTLVKHKFTPASSILHPDPDGLLQEETWYYCSVVSKLNFMATNTHPDISFAAHQCTKCSNQPCLLHEKAIKHIGHYLHLTRNQGLIL